MYIFQDISLWNAMSRISIDLTGQRKRKQPDEEVIEVFSDADEEDALNPPDVVAYRKVVQEYQEYAQYCSNMKQQTTVEQTKQLWKSLQKILKKALEEVQDIQGDSFGKLVHAKRILRRAARECNEKYNLFFRTEEGFIVTDSVKSTQPSLKELLAR